MKKIFVPLVLIAAVSLVFTGCAGDEDDIFSASAAERLNESSAKYSARLEAQPNGWAMQYYPTYQDEYPYGSGYLILMRFNPDFSVDVSMDNRFSNNAYASATSAWEVIKDNGPVLSFNSYNQCMHAFSDPEDIPWTEDNEQSEGCGGDYEFIIVDAPEDASYMMLKGKKRNTYNLLTPIEVGVDYQEYLADVKAFHNKMFSSSAPIGNYLCFGPDSIYHMDDATDGLPNIYPFGTDAIANESFNPFLITKRGQDYYLRFRDAFERDFIEGTLQELRYDSIQDQFIGTDNPEFIIKSTPAPDFFMDKFTNNHVFKVSRTADDTEISDKMRKVLTDAHNGIKAVNKSYFLNELSLKIDEENGARWSYRYQTGKAAKDIEYIYTCLLNGDKIAFGYQKADQTNGENIKSRVEAISDMLEQTLSQQFIVSKFVTTFNLSKILFTAVNDPDIWFVVYY